MKTKSVNFESATLQTLVEMAENKNVSPDNFAIISRDRKKCHWEKISKPAEVIMTLHDLLIRAKKEYPNISAKDIYFTISPGKDPDDGLPVFNWRLSASFELLFGNSKTIH